jgi:hypothetical protein
MGERLGERDFLWPVPRRARETDDTNLPACTQCGLDREVGELPGAPCLAVTEAHRGTVVEDQVDPWGDLFAPQFERVGAGAGVGLPIDMTRVIARCIGALILELERTAGSPASQSPTAPRPAGVTYGEVDDGRGQLPPRMDLGMIHAVVLRDPRT